MKDNPLSIEKLRHWKKADAGWFRDMDNACFPAPNETFLNGANYHWWLAWYGGDDMVGYAGLYVDGDNAHFCRAGILPDWRGGNWQRDLIRTRLTWCRRRGIKTVRTYTNLTNYASQKNLEAEGFRHRLSRDHLYYKYTMELR